MTTSRQPFVVHKFTFLENKPNGYGSSVSGSCVSERGEPNLTTLQYTAEEDRHTEKGTFVDGHSYDGTVVRGGVNREDSASQSG